MRIEILKNHVKPERQEKPDEPKYDQKIEETLFDFSIVTKQYHTMTQQDTASFPSAFSSYVPRHRKVYGCICISPNKRILLVKGLGGKWSLPKGHMETNETDLQCALRELYEETGIHPENTYSSYKKLAVGGYFVFHFSSEPRPSPRDIDEIECAEWVDLNDIFKLNCNLDLNFFLRWVRKSYSSLFNLVENPPAT